MSFSHKTRELLQMNESNVVVQQECIWRCIEVMLQCMKLNLHVYLVFHIEDE